MWTGMVERVSHPGRIRGLYSRFAPVYDLFSGYERPHHREAIRRAEIRPDDRVLEVACGTGQATVAIARRLGAGGRLVAVDLTPAMLRRARRKLKRCGLVDRVETAVGDARRLAFDDDTFDVLYNGFMFDLVDVDGMARILAEFKRVLKPGGRLVVVSTSKDSARRTVYETLYERGLLGFVSGGCRPVLLERYVNEAGFEDVQRTFHVNRSWLPLARFFGAEIVTATKPTPS
ncbi:MAG TPA: methyltransferase domain-containing protein [Planctomycetota bacterium]|nr:methyltransferase domain-containing protein [Planctomycetota bacterium]